MNVSLPLSYSIWRLTMSQLPPELVSLERASWFVDSHTLAEKYHHGQKRRNGRDFIEHPRDAASELVRASLSTPLLVGTALLHDVLEANRIAAKFIREEIRRDIGAEHAVLIDALTDDPTLARDDRKKAARLKLLKAPPEAMLVKLADRAANLTDIPTDAPADWIRQYLLETDCLLAVARGIYSPLENRLQFLLTTIRSGKTPHANWSPPSQGVLLHGYPKASGSLGKI
jgi:(p)ppGpp synthase/HD superfamily hydrolase